MKTNKPVEYDFFINQNEDIIIDKVNNHTNEEPLQWYDKFTDFRFRLTEENIVLYNQLVIPQLMAGVIPVPDEYPYHFHFLVGPRQIYLLNHEIEPNDFDKVWLERVKKFEEKNKIWVYHVNPNFSIYEDFMWKYEYTRYDTLVKLATEKVWDGSYHENKKLISHRPSFMYEQLAILNSGKSHVPYIIASAKKEKESARENRKRLLKIWAKPEKEKVNTHDDWDLI